MAGWEIPELNEGFWLGKSSNQSGFSSHVWQPGPEKWHPMLSKEALPLLF
jgi:hypothetical protein